VIGTGALLSSLTPAGATNIIFGIVPNNINFFIQALHGERLGKLLAQPRLVTLSGRPATFLSGGQQAVPEVTASGVGGGTVGTRFIEFGTQLTFLPIVLGNGKIYLEVEPVVSNLDPGSGFAIGGVIVPGRTEQRVRTSVMMEPGQTFAIGGLIQTTIGGETAKTPVLGDLPFLGPLFSRITYNEIENELLVMVTPYLVDPMDCKQAPCKLPGLETRSPDDFELFLELILEAPRGQRDVFPGRKYRPAWQNDVTADKFPCGNGGNGACGNGGTGACANGACGNGNGAWNVGSHTGMNPPVVSPTMAPAASVVPAATVVPAPAVPSASFPPPAEGPEVTPAVTPASYTAPARPPSQP
jgi:pilus assembly protein CpaC